MSLPIPYLAFRDQAREAMEFYRTVFGGDLQATTFAQAGYPTGDADLVMHARLGGNGVELMASDTPEGMPFHGGSQIGLSLVGPSSDEPRLRGWFEALSDGGTVELPLELQSWGDLYGDVTDRYGIRWLVDIEQDA